jgi:hypothetical protein
MKDREAASELLHEKAGYALSQPGVLALERGYRIRGGHLVDDREIVRATVARKIDPNLLSADENLGNLFGHENVDVVEATPLRRIFANPKEFGLDSKSLAELEDRAGYPFLEGAIGVKPLQSISAEARLRRSTYKPPKGVPLNDIEGQIRLTCHASPDAGWKVLRSFLRQAERELVVGMYDLTAPHIGDTLANEVSGRVRRFTLTMDKKISIGEGTKKDDRTEGEHVSMFSRAFGSGFRYAYARTGNHGTFFSDYHIKLAVADRKAFWLSSGSWQSSNQPKLDPLGVDKDNPQLPLYNREWHLVGVHEAVSEVWATFLEWDFETAKEEGDANFRNLLRANGPFVFAESRPDEFPYERFWEPEVFNIVAGRAARVVPLLTPDNYIEELIKLVDQAGTELLVQNQSLTFLRSEEMQDPRYTSFTKLLAKKSHDLDQFKLIIRNPREFGGSIEDALNIYGHKGFNTRKIQFQTNCHNKGIIADRRKVLVGSHNFTNAGTTANRDASLLIESEDVANYFRKIFDHDWEVASNLAKARASRPPPRMLLAGANELPPPGMRRYNIWDLLDLD